MAFLGYDLTKAKIHCLVYMKAMDFLLCQYVVTISSGTQM